LADSGDLLVIGLTNEETLIVFIAKSNTTFESQLLWLFALDGIGDDFSVKKIEEANDIQINFAFRYVFEELGIEIKEINDNYLDRIIQTFGDTFPKTQEFSLFARKMSQPVQIEAHPDDAIITWIEHEEMLFRTFERYLVSEKLKKGFINVDDFISYSLSVQNRRKSRAGFALEHHLEYIFQYLGISYSRGEKTENKAKPDFIFPSIKAYRTKSFDSSKLTMLGVKSTCKDRWRQVLSEAARIKNKHLFTLEPSISINQTNEMKANLIQLVIPKILHSTYHKRQQNWLLDLAEFIAIVRKRS
jgi:hypothetical protein